MRWVQRATDVFPGKNMMPATLVNVVAMAPNIAAAWAGHYYLTYRKGGGQHTFCGPRFANVTAILEAATVAGTHVAVKNFRASPYIVSTLGAVRYPVARLLLHNSGRSRVIKTQIM